MYIISWKFWKEATVYNTRRNSLEGAIITMTGWLNSDEIQWVKIEKSEATYAA